MSLIRQAYHAVQQARAATRYSLRGALRRPRSFEEQIYTRLVYRGDTVFDVGANTGSITVLLSRLAGAQGSVVAFEPVWPVYLQLCAQIQARPSKATVKPLWLGLSNAAGVRDIHVPDGNFGMGSTAPKEQWAAAQSGQHIDSYRCHFTTLDIFLSDKPELIPTFVKIDVEGAERFVLEGARDTLSKFMPLMLIEVFAPWQKAFGYGPWEVLKALMTWRYAFLFMCPDGLVAHEPSEAKPFPPGYERGYNIIAFNSERHGHRIQALQPLLRGRGGVFPMDGPPSANVP